MKKTISLAALTPFTPEQFGHRSAKYRGGVLRSYDISRGKTTNSFKSAGDYPNFAQCAEQNGTGTIRFGMVPRTKTVLKTASTFVMMER